MFSGTTLLLWYCGIMFSGTTLLLWYCGIMFSGTTLLLWYCGIMFSGTTLLLLYCGIMFSGTTLLLLYCGIMFSGTTLLLWYCGIMFSETNEILVKPTGRKLPPEIQQKPSAHLIGSSRAVGEDSVVLWESDMGLSAFTDQMDYKDGRLVAQRNGHYYVYSKVHFVEDCFLFKHKVMRITEGYRNKPLVLMKANRFHCPSQDSRPKKISHQNLLNSYLGGVFRLLPGDIIYVTVDNGTLLRLGAEDNFMGAFMI
ncbi:tumor necrosis factor ligand superfamily member 14-like isoform X1 [Oncorhynchus nerka]|uniref:tumor necrosis factor ligand superfamily member 14-like isoform X1 n=1 Tax=Oncorhynchus nerka TaxID=8023 RepID=UPI0031B823A1